MKKGKEVLGLNPIMLGIILYGIIILMGFLTPIINYIMFREWEWSLIGSYFGLVLPWLIFPIIITFVIFSGENNEK